MEAIEAVSTVEVPAECKEYFVIVQAFANALNDMHEWERNHNLQQHPMAEMAYYHNHADEFAQRWFEGYFNKKN